MRSLRTDTDEFHVHGREIYWLRRKKQDGSTFSSVPLNKRLKQTACLFLAERTRINQGVAARKMPLHRQVNE